MFKGGKKTPKRGKGTNRTLGTIEEYRDFVWVIAWGRVKLRINITRVFRNCRNCPSRVATRAISAISENTSDINP